MKKLVLLALLFVSCGRDPAIHSIPTEATDVFEYIPVRVEVEDGRVIIVMEPVDAGEPEVPDSGSVEGVDAGLDLPGKSNENGRCDAGRGLKKGLVKHGKCL